MTAPIQRAGQSTLVQPLAVTTLQRARQSTPVIQAAPAVTALTVYDQVRRVYTFVASMAPSLPAIRREFGELPIEMRHQIFRRIYIIANFPQTDDLYQWSETHMLDSIPRLQRAIEQVACNAFDTLEQNQKDLVVSRIWMHFKDNRRNHPSLEKADERRKWGEIHVKKNVEILLESLRDMDLTPEFWAALDTWVKEASSAPGSQVEKRQRAKQEILFFLDHRAVTLDLAQLSLRSLPHIFHVASFIRAQGLALSSNCLTVLPAEIGRLRALCCLLIDSNKLTALPVEIGQLHSLQELDIRNNELTALPVEIGQLYSLQELDISNNELTALPVEIGQLHSLQKLNVGQNHLTTLPVEIKDLSKLRYLSLAHNPLTVLPACIFELPRECLVDLTGINLSEPMLEQLKQLLKSPDYRGPKEYIFSYIDCRSDIILETAVGDGFLQIPPRGGHHCLL